MFVTQLCVSTRCDQCGDRCWEDWDYRPHWSSESEARTDLAERDWQLREDRMLCPGCAALETCHAFGHQFSAWWSCRCGPGQVGRCGTCATQTRVCERCSRTEHRPTPLPAPGGAGRGVA